VSDGEGRRQASELNKRKSSTHRDRINVSVLREELADCIFARNIVYRPEIDSTNTLAKTLGAQGAPEGTLVIAEKQKKGRGRRGRSWHSPGYVNLLFSVLLRPPIPARQAFVLTMVLAVSAGQAIEELTGLRSMIKWPNDLYVGERKLAGILTEFSLQSEGIEYGVLGLGLNVNWEPGEIWGIAPPATSILVETGMRVDRTALLIQLLKSFEKSYGNVKSGEIDSFYRTWNERSMILGKDVIVSSKGQRIQARAQKIDLDGALVIVDSEGKEKKIVSADVSIRLAKTR